MRAIYKTHKNKLSLVTEADKPKNSSLVKPRRWNNFIVKFQNLKQIVIIRSNQKKINVKIDLKQIKSNFFSRKIWNKSCQNFSTVVRKLRNSIYYLNACYTHPIIYPKCIGSGIENNGKPNKLLSVMTVCRHNGVMACMLQFC